MKLQRAVNLIIIVVVVFLFSPYVSFSHDLVFPAEKLKALYPEAISFEQKDLYISDQQRLRIEGKLKVSLPEEDLKPSIYFVIAKQTESSPPRKTAVIIFIDAYGNAGKIEIGIVVGKNGKLMRILLFENNESAKLSEQSFLQQFEGKTISDAFEVAMDIVAPKGIEETARAIASGARRGLYIINEILSKK
jgi:hypothetical protein